MTDKSLIDEYKDYLAYDYDTINPEDKYNLLSFLTRHHKMITSRNDILHNEFEILIFKNRFNELLQDVIKPRRLKYIVYDDGCSYFLGRG